MKILQLNIWGGKLGTQVTELLNREQADIVCLQEAVRFEGGRSFLFSDLASIQKDTAYTCCYFNPHLSYKLMNRTASMGLAILAKKPVITEDSFFIKNEHIDNFDTLESDYNVQSLQRVTIEQNGEPLHIVNYHGYHVREHKEGDGETFRQCHIIAEYVKKLTGSVVVCGDFNLTPSSESLKVLNEALVNHTKINDMNTTRSYLTKKAEACDYIFTSKDMDIKHFAVLDDIVSDHKALTVEL